MAEVLKSSQILWEMANGQPLVVMYQFIGCEFSKIGGTAEDCRLCSDQIDWWLLSTCSQAELSSRLPQDTTRTTSGALSCSEWESYFVVTASALASSSLHIFCGIVLGVPRSDRCDQIGASPGLRGWNNHHPPWLESFDKGKAAKTSISGTHFRITIFYHIIH